MALAKGWSRLQEQEVFLRGGLDLLVFLVSVGELDGRNVRNVIMMLESVWISYSTTWQQIQIWRETRRGKLC